MRTARIALALVVALAIACPMLAAGENCQSKCESKCKSKKAPACPAAQRVDKMVAGLKLTDAQKASLAAVKKEYGPKLTAAIKKLDVTTPEQKKAAAEAAKAAKAAGKTGKDVAKAAAAAVNLTDAQKTQLACAKKDMGTVEKDLCTKVMAVLTPEQKQELKKCCDAKKKCECKCESKCKCQSKCESKCQSKCESKKAPACPAAQRVDKMVAGLKLTDAQKTSLAAVKKEYGPKLMAAIKKLDVKTPEQKKAIAEAAKEAKAAGKKGKELHQAIEAAVTLTEAQKTQLAEAKKTMGALEKELRQKVMSVLTPEQKDQLKKAHQAKKQCAK